MGGKLAQVIVRSPEKQAYPRVSVVIPARNEARNLPYVLPYIPALVTEVILIDGNSSDDTIAVAQELLPTVHIVRQVGRGKGDALRAGFAACTGDIIVMLDADGSADPREITRFVDALAAGSDFAKGSRFLLGSRSHDITWLRRWGNHGLTRLVNILYGTHFTDLCYGYNAFWRRCLEHINIDSDGFEIETLLNVQIHTAGLKIVEVPSIEYGRIHGVTNLNVFRDGWRILLTIVREYWKNCQAARRAKIMAVSPSEEVVL
jgi:glycosyltransferase involved in cell wall biosynthesis